MQSILVKFKDYSIKLKQVRVGILFIYIQAYFSKPIYGLFHVGDNTKYANRGFSK